MILVAMPTLDWMGKEKATKADRDVATKMLREDQGLSYGMSDDNMGEEFDC